MCYPMSMRALQGAWIAAVASSLAVMGPAACGGEQFSSAPTGGKSGTGATSGGARGGSGNTGTTGGTSSSGGTTSTGGMGTMGGTNSSGGVSSVGGTPAMGGHPSGGTGGTSGNCTTDPECPPGHWCRPTEAGGTQCVPFAKEGEICGGYVPEWFVQICSQGLVCADFPPFVADAPGVCRKPCANDGECPTEGYCSVGEVCRKDGSCFEHRDCDLAGNAFPVAVGCIGYAVCDPSQECVWECDTRRAACRDLAGLAFGPCDMVLGWAVIQGACVSVSGCDARGYEFFPDADTCNTSCFPV